MWTPNIFTLVVTITVVSAMPNKQEDKILKFLKPSFENLDCITNSDCPDTRACKNSTCINPCNVWCAEDSVCEVANHIMTKCSCPENKIGDPLVGCKDVEEEGAYNPCEEGFGGVATCSEIFDHIICSCGPKNFYERPILRRPECIFNSDCANNFTCIRNDCVDPCPNACGTDAYCTVPNHIPICDCPPNMTGNPFIHCDLIEDRNDVAAIVVCSPSPCGPNSKCQDINSQAVCSCLSGYIGSPPSCRPECVINSDCSMDQACRKLKCVDPCVNTCGKNAECLVVIHEPMCFCLPRTTGNPFVGCKATEVDPCSPSPCGPNSLCRNINDQPACDCIAGYLGHPPNCRPECTITDECSDKLACINQHCRDPCLGACGDNALCVVEKHVPVCTCPTSFTGNPFTKCSKIEENMREHIENENNNLINHSKGSNDF